jgi:hypothetical protein
VVTETGEYEVNGWAGAVNEVDGGGGGGIPDGSYVGQPSYWNGTAWAPLAIGDLLSLTQLRCPADESLNLGAFGSGGSVNVGAGDFATYKVGFAAGPNGFIVGVLESGIALQVQAAGYDPGGGGVPCIGMFGATPVPRQSITGVTEALQIESIIAALVAFGLVSDDR